MVAPRTKKGRRGGVESDWSSLVAHITNRLLPVGMCVLHPLCSNVGGLVPAPVLCTTPIKVSKRGLLHSIVLAP